MIDDILRSALSRAREHVCELGREVVRIFPHSVIAHEIAHR
jgi:hypothetical protein